MIASKPVAASEGDGLDPIDRAARFIEAARQAAADGLTWSEFGQLLVALLRTMMAVYDGIAPMPGAQKKSLVLEAAGRLFDAVAPMCVPLPLWPLWGLLRPAIRSLVLALASGAIEQLLPLVRLSA